MLTRRAVVASLGATALTGCATIDSGPNADLDVVTRAAYRHDGPPALTLFTMINNRTGSGAHTSMILNGSQRVIWDPAGSVRLSNVPELNDVLYGVTPQVARIYESAHARITYHVRMQTVHVPLAVADQAIALAQQSGPVSKSACTSSTVGILRQLPGFEGFTTTLFPNRLAEQFAELPLVEDRRRYENDSDDKDAAIAALEAEGA